MIELVVRRTRGGEHARDHPSNRIKVACTVDTTDRGPSDIVGIDVGHQPMPVHVVFVRAKVGMLSWLGNWATLVRPVG